MAKSYIVLTLCLVALSMGVEFGSLSMRAPYIDQLAERCSGKLDHEQLFGCGCRVPLAQAELYDLIQLSSISDSIATEILHSRESLITEFQSQANLSARSVELEQEMLQEIKYIGPAKARLLAEFVTLESSAVCLFR